MCRYGNYGPYKEPFACFACRKSFKQTSRWELAEHLRLKPGEARVVLCPECREPMADMGHDFKPPKRTNRDQWKKVEVLFAHGFTFHSCGCCGPGLRPAELKDVAHFLSEHAAKRPGERLLERIAANKERRRGR